MCVLNVVRVLEYSMYSTSYKSVYSISFIHDGMMGVESDTSVNDTRYCSTSTLLPVES